MRTHYVLSAFRVEEVRACLLVVVNALLSYRYQQMRASATDTVALAGVEDDNDLLQLRWGSNPFFFGREGVTCGHEIAAAPAGLSIL
jgi:hypothetical protein